MSKTPYLLLITFVFLGACRDEPTAADQPTQVQVGPSGTEVQAGSTMVSVQEGEVRTQAGGTTVTVNENGVNIPGLGTIATGAGEPDVSSTDTSPIICDSSDNVIRNGVTIDGGLLPAITASGSCTVVCNDCTLRSNTSAVTVSGSGNVTLNGGSVNGGFAAITASGSGHVTTNDTEISGRVSKSGSAEVTQN